jgi:hypothetical protein
MNRRSGVLPLNVRYVMVLVGFATLGALAGCGGNTSTGTGAQATVTVTAPASPGNSASATVDDSTSQDSNAASGGNKSAGDVFVMPNVVGQVLQTAQDRLQSLGSYVMDQQDAGGLERLQMLDSNWKVCSQKPSPGAKIATSDLVTLASVKLEETCP